MNGVPPFLVVKVFLAKRAYCAMLETGLPVG